MTDTTIEPTDGWVNIISGEASSVPGADGGEYYCDYCEEYNCGDDDHEAEFSNEDNSGYDAIADPSPWEQKGFLYAADGYQTATGNPLKDGKVTGEINLSACIANFYLLEAMSGMACPVPALGNKTPKPVGAINPHLRSYLPKKVTSVGGALFDVAVEAGVLLDGFADWLAPHVDNYLHYAIATEMGFHPWIRNRWQKSANVGASAWQHIVITHGKATAADWATTTFMDLDRWSGGYGREAWAGISKCVSRYAKGEFETGTPFTKLHFLDQAFSLEHNGGCAFNKSPWGGLEQVKDTLDGHHESNIKRLLMRSEGYQNNLSAGYPPSELATMAGAMSSLFSRYSDLVGEL